MTVAFTEAAARENIATGEKMSTIMGKIKKFFTDLTAPAFAQMITSSDDLLATKVTGYVPDAKAVADTYTELNRKLGSLIKEGSFTATTDASGLITAGNSGVSAVDRIVICAFVPSYLVKPYINAAKTAYGFSVSNTWDNNPYANQNVTVTYYYIENN